MNKSPVWVTVLDIDESGILQTESGLLFVYVGDAKEPPTYDTQRSVVPEAKLRLTVHEGDFSRLDLDPGRYWLWQIKNATAIVASCEEDGVSDPDPA